MATTPISDPPTFARIPSLDGLRALSIALVFFGHLRGTAGFPYSPGQVDYGNVGVRVFFVISGYLISRLLFRELEKTSTISLGKFYLRRSFRIFPAFYVCIAVTMLLAAMGAITLRPGDAFHALTYTTNYHADRAWGLGHMWSLAVEEQFYLLWPAALLLLGRARGLRVAAAFLCLAPIVRMVTFRMHLSDPVRIGETFETIGDALATGCLLAGLQTRLESSAKYMRVLRSRVFVVVPLLGFGAASLHWHPNVDLAVGQTTINVCIALTIHYCLVNARGRVGRVLNARPLVYAGTLSYSLYLWQQLFLDRTSHAFAASFPVNVVLAVSAALLSSYAVERPCLAARERFERVVFRGPEIEPSV